MKISEIITDKYKLRLQPTVYYDLLADVYEAEEDQEQDILDKIRAEIEDTGAYEQEVHGKTEFLRGITFCLGVINAYKD